MSDTPTLIVIGWDETFENNRSREMKSAKWFACPNSFDGDRISELLAHENGAAHYGAWCAILGTASTCGTRGTLLRDNGKPYCADSLSWKTRIRADVFLEAIERMLHIGLLEADYSQPSTDDGLAGIPQEGAVKPQEGAVIPHESAAGSLPFYSVPFSSSSPKEVTKTKKSQRRQTLCTTSQAGALFAIYPRRVEKAQALTEIQSAVKRIADDKAHPGHGDPLTWLMRRVKLYADSPHGQPPPAGEPDYRLYPSRWYKKSRYDDDESEWQQPNGDGPPGRNPKNQGPDDWRKKKADREYPHDEDPPRML